MARVAAQVIDRDRGWASVKSTFAAAKGRSVKIGFPAGIPPHKGEDGPVDMATIAAVHEFGARQTITPRQAAWMNANLTAPAPEGFIGPPRPLDMHAGMTLVTPARPVVVRTMLEHADKYARLGTRLIEDADKGPPSSGPAKVDHALKLIGERAAADLKMGYRNAYQHVQPLSPITIEERQKRSSPARRRRGNAQAAESKYKPLQDTGDLLRAVRYELDRDGVKP